MNPMEAKQPTVTVVGGGLAGIASACALAGAGFQVTVLERRPYLGGRASSYQHPGADEVVDNCQHVLLGCCTNLIHLYGRLGVEEHIHWYDDLTFLEPGGRQSKIRPSWLPAPFHSAPSFLAASSLSFADKAGIARALLALAAKLPPESDEHFLAWLRRHRQTQNAIDRFWKVVLVSALNEDLDRLSVHYAAQVFRESFLKSAPAGRMGVPAIPLSELYGVAASYLKMRGGAVQTRIAADSFSADREGVRVTAPGSEFVSDYLVLAVPFEALPKLLPVEPDSEALLDAVAKFEHSPITGIHLWFDRQITDLDHAVLLDRTIQWMFHKSKLLGREDGPGSYVELVVSASRELVNKSKQEIVALAVRELCEFFPRVGNARLLKQTVIKEIHATYSARPRSDDHRPGAATRWPRVFLAGDWTYTGWPATMEGAVRSGYSAAEHVARAAGREQSFLRPDLPPAGFMRLFKK